MQMCLKKRYLQKKCWFINVYPFLIMSANSQVSFPQSPRCFVQEAQIHWPVQTSGDHGEHHIAERTPGSGIESMDIHGTLAKNLDILNF